MALARRMREKRNVKMVAALLISVFVPVAAYSGQVLTQQCTNHIKNLSNLMDSLADDFAKHKGTRANSFECRLMRDKFSQLQDEQKFIPSCFTGDDVAKYTATSREVNEESRKAFTRMGCD